MESWTTISRLIGAAVSIGAEPIGAGRSIAVVVGSAIAGNSSAAGLRQGFMRGRNKVIKDYQEDGDRRYIAGTAKRWDNPSDWEKEAVEAISDFDGWLEGLDDNQVKEIVRSLSRTMEQVTIRVAQEWER